MFSSMEKRTQNAQCFIIENEVSRDTFQWDRRIISNGVVGQETHSFHAGITVYHEI